MSSVKCLKNNVLEEAQKRISFVFDEFNTIIVSISGGKDSTVLFHLAMQEAIKRDRKVGVFFLDEEVMYQATINQVEYMMSLYPEHIIRLWLQIPFNLTNSVSNKTGYVECWSKKDKKKWMRKRNGKNILYNPWSHKTLIKNNEIGLDFYDVFTNFEMTYEKTAFLVGLRAVESPNRWRTMVKNAGYEEVMWSTKRCNDNVSFYPIYDWLVSDIWKYIGENNIKYHAYYDFSYKKGVHPHLMRVSSLVHEKSFKSIQELPEFEPETYDKLLKRTEGISFAQETAKNKTMFKVQKLPKAYKTWRDYRDFLLLTFPDEHKKQIFIKRFSKHLNNDFVARQQCRQLVLNDFENNLPIKNTEDPIQEKIKYWREVL